MSFDFTTLEPVAEQMAKAALPTLATILKAAAPFPFNLFVGGALSMAADALGLGPTATPQDVQAKIAADPVAAATVLQPVEDHFADQVKAAQDQLDSELKDAQDARQTEVAYVAAKSPLEWVAAAYTAAVMSLFVFVVATLVLALIWPPARDPGTNTTIYNLLIFFLGALLTEVARCGQFWLGSSHGSKSKDKTLSDLAKTPQVVQGPNSRVNTVESKRR